MIVFGWLCLLAITIYASVGAVAITYVCIGLSGKIGAECVFFMSIALGLIFITYAYFPFAVELKP